MKNSQFCTRHWPHTNPANREKSIVQYTDAREESRFYLVSFSNIDCVGSESRLDDDWSQFLSQASVCEFEEGAFPRFQQYSSVEINRYENFDNFFQMVEKSWFFKVVDFFVEITDSVRCVVGVRQQLDAESVLGWVTGAPAPVRGLHIETLSGRSFFHVDWGQNLPNVSVPVFRSFPVPSCKYDTNIGENGCDHILKGGTSGGKKVKKRGNGICKRR